MNRYDDRTALLVVDVQNDFAHPQGSLSVRGGMDVIDVVNSEVAAAHAASALRVYTQDWHPADTPHFEKDGGVWPVHCVQESWGAQLIDGLQVASTVLRKGTGGEDGYSAFTVRHPESGAEAPTELEQMLRSARVERLVIVGLATDYCVKETALDAARLGFATMVLRDGIRAVDLRPGDGDRALEEIAAAGCHIV